MLVKATILFQLSVLSHRTSRGCAVHIDLKKKKRNIFSFVSEIASSIMIAVVVCDLSRTVRPGLQRSSGK